MGRICQELIKYCIHSVYSYCIIDIYLLNVCVAKKSKNHQKNKHFANKSDLFVHCEHIVGLRLRLVQQEPAPAFGFWIEEYWFLFDCEARWSGPKNSFWEVYMKAHETSGQLDRLEELRMTSLDNFRQGRRLLSRFDNFFSQWILTF